MFIVLMAIGLMTGALVGTVGIGGVLLVPALVLIGGLAVHEATPIATLSFLFTGIAGSLAYARQRRIRLVDRKMAAGWLCTRCGCRCRDERRSPGNRHHHCDRRNAQHGSGAVISAIHPPDRLCGVVLLV